MNEKEFARRELDIQDRKNTTHQMQSHMTQMGKHGKDGGLCGKTCTAGAEGVCRKKLEDQLIN